MTIIGPVQDGGENVADLRASFFLLFDWLSLSFSVPLSPLLSFYPSLFFQHSSPFTHPTYNTHNPTWLQSLRTPPPLCSTRPTTLACSSPCTFYFRHYRKTNTGYNPSRRGGVVRVMDHFLKDILPTRTNSEPRLALQSVTPQQRRAEYRRTPDVVFVDISYLASGRHHSNVYKTAPVMEAYESTTTLKEPYIL